MTDDDARRLDRILDREAQRTPRWLASAQGSFDHFVFPDRFLERVHQAVLPSFEELATKIGRGGWRTQIVSTERPADHLFIPAGFGRGDTALCFSRTQGPLWNPAAIDASFSIHGDRASASVFRLERRSWGEDVRVDMGLAELTVDRIATLVIDFFEAIVQEEVVHSERDGCGIRSLPAT